MREKKCHQPRGEGAGCYTKKQVSRGAQIELGTGVNGWRAQRAVRDLAGGGVGWGGDEWEEWILQLFDPLHVGKCAPVRLDSGSSRLQLALLVLWLMMPIPARPLLPRSQRASCLPESGLCPIFSLIELMLPSAPRTHGIAVFGSGPDYNRREKEKRTANKAISFNCESHWASCFLWVTSLKRFWVGSLN